ncbi:MULTISPECIES: hypothetical protein [unclassified Clostridium]|uniref:hypothetical protein n=1 Tax=unclassified Clostridium TaxID=2614128 RepID=UPI00207947DE|nr:MULTISPECIES: hypothetical protein [unclassified Clostridium]
MNVNLNDENGINISSSGDLSLGASGGVSLSGGSVSISGSNKVVVQKNKSSYISLEVECYNQSNAVYENGSCRETYELFTDDDPQNGVQEALAELEYKNELLSLSILGSNVMLNVVMQNDKINDINKSENNNSTIDKSGNSGSDSKSTLKSAFYALGGGISKFSTFARDASLEFGEKVLGLNYDQCAVDSKSNRKLRDMYAEDDRRDAEDYDKLRGKAPNKDIFDNVSKVTSGGLILIDTVIAGHGLINIAKSGISLAKFSGKAQNILKFGDKIANKTKNTVNTIEELNRLKNTNGTGKAIESAGGTNTFVEDISHITGKTAMQRNKAINSIINEDLSNIDFRKKPQYSPFSQTGIAQEGSGTHIGKKSFSSRTQLRDTIIHEELHQRWWERGIYDHHPVGTEKEAKFYKTIERYFRMRGWETLKEYEASKPRLL